MGLLALLHQLIVIIIILSEYLSTILSYHITYLAHLPTRVLLSVILVRLVIHHLSFRHSLRTTLFESRLHGRCWVWNSFLVHLEATELGLVLNLHLLAVFHLLDELVHI